MELNEKKGKAYASRKAIYKRPANDLYITPKGLVYELLANVKELQGAKTILDPCCGTKSMSTLLKKHGYEVTEKDIMYGNDFLKDQYLEHYDCVVTNPPFSKWNEFIEKSLAVADKAIVIGRLNYFGSHERNVTGFWDKLSKVYAFDRQIAYNGEERKDGMARCGCLVTGWFVFDNSNKDLPKIKVLDIQKWILNKKNVGVLKA